MSEPPLRVALLATSWPRDEHDFAGRFLADAVERLQARGVEFELVVPGRFRHFGLAYGGGVVANAKRRPWLVPLFLVSMLVALRRAAARCDFVHAHWLLSGVVAAFGGRPFVLTLHGSGSAGRFEDLRLARDHPRAFGWIVRRATVVVGVSAPLVDAARVAGARRAEEIPHGVDVPDELPKPSAATPVVLFAGRLSPEKGVDVLVEAMRELDGVRLVVAGDGPQRRLVPDALGFVSSERLRELYREASMVVMPSRREGFGVVALEAMAHGLPVIGTRVGGLARLVEHERTGLLVEPDDPAALRAAIERLRDEPELRARLGAAGHRQARERYGWERVTDSVLELYRSVAARAAG